MPKNQPEYELQTAVCDLIRRKYPHALFLSDTVAFLGLTMPQAVRNKKIQCADFHCPDVLIFEPRGKFHGLFIELKAKSIYKKDGVTLLKNDHIAAQSATIEKLNERGYYARFATSFDEAAQVLGWYFG